MTVKNTIMKGEKKPVAENKQHNNKLFKLQLIEIKMSKEYHIGGIEESVIDPKERGIVQASLIKQGLSSDEIRRRMEQIEVMVMDSQISKTHPNESIRTVAATNSLTDEEKYAIYEMTQSTQLLPHGLSKSGDRATRERKPLGIEIISVDDYAHTENPTKPSGDELEQRADLLMRYSPNPAETGRART